MTPDNARLLADFGLSPADLIGEGGESLVYALGEAHILRLPKRRPFDARSRIKLKGLLDEIRGRLPFATPTIEEVGAHGAYTIEVRLAGRSMAAFLPSAADDPRDHAFRNYVAAIETLRTVAFDDRPYGHLVAAEPVTADDWRTFAWESLVRFRSQNRVAIAQDVGDPYRLFDKAADMIDTLPLMPPKVLVHGDYFPGNVLLGPDLSVAAVIAFGPFTVAGDPVLDLAVAYLTLELITECSADDARFVRQLIVERHGEEIAPALRFYRAYLAFSMADPANNQPPYPRLYGWAIAMLRLLGEDRLPV